MYPAARNWLGQDIPVLAAGAESPPQLQVAARERCGLLSVALTEKAYYASRRVADSTGQSCREKGHLLEGGHPC